ncbi:hypothetical protein CPC16_008245 [Podila verticillata]|nr:hypothetical protein BGZ52_011109 [Haplosporangium bisporale]KAF9211482.1 hypothetical protein BGZ59_008005 [Podila verticillata]KAF9384855.1 hypothetical protein CPC16_008245 [Podila verticillata]KFH69918.1 hypothetical protein MVEG_04722 [Podila verticillata NRRL 6337]
MRSSLSFLVAIISTLIALTGFSAQAQSTNCHTCIQKAITAVANCTTLTATQLTTIDTIIHGADVSNFQTQDPTSFSCLVALMWDSIQYKGQLWGKCLNPDTACPWAEMMQYLEMIPRTAAIYGAPNPPAQVLLNGPA